ncbi:phosphotransferase [Paenibacillus silagei]|uniref:Ser/Thr protein kinase RdoA (MazF antagonist) n=1 Tax=Paenibacillus silagei TaxID=1670801 RepID=A0ABS4NU04_9BACL|nr:phosphotransferase [Paenibacillus silagei]MBP2113543.1 Ser/Thr protein kinase RdoA (MazF antagonist) [Paenibacillus silagei]
MSDTAARIRDEILDSMTQRFGLHVTEAVQIDQGFLNLKWRLDSDQGRLFVKQYSKVRYPEALTLGLEVSLSHQDHLYLEGLPVPKLFSHEGNYVLRTPSQERYVLMTLCDGHSIAPGSATEQQMYSLGRVVGRMHKLLNAQPASLPLYWEVRSKASMVRNWEARYHQAAARQSEDTLSALELQRRIIDRMDTGIFADCERGWGHRDLFVDNMLFSADQVAAILDFDRLHFVYPEFDIARPILSCALSEDGIGQDRVRAFVTGYREYTPLPASTLIRSLKLTWWKEAEWIAVPQQDEFPPLVRFRQENHWIAANWDRLNDIFTGI